MQALDKILSIQNEINVRALSIDMPLIDIINAEEESRIRELIANKTFPNKWDGDEIGGEVIVNKIYNDGTILPVLF